MGVNEIARIIKQSLDGGSVLLLGAKPPAKSDMKARISGVTSYLPPRKASASGRVGPGITSCAQIDETLQVAGYKDIHGR